MFSSIFDHRVFTGYLKKKREKNKDIPHRNFRSRVRKYPVGMFCSKDIRELLPEDFLGYTGNSAGNIRP